MILRPLLISLVFLLTAFPVSSRSEADFGGLAIPFIADRPGSPRSQISLDEAVQRVRRETGGRILAAETVRKDGIPAHRIKVLMPSGRVRVFYVDAGGN